MRFSVYPVAAAALSLSLVSSGPVSAAGFDCKKAKQCPESAICEDAELSQLDDDLNANYSALRDCAKKIGGSVQYLLDKQRDWLGDRATCGCDVDCLHTSYQARNGVLENTLAKDCAGQ